MAEGARLESVFRFIPNESSNLSLTAIYRFNENQPKPETLIKQEFRVFLCPFVTNKKP